MLARPSAESELLDAIPYLRSYAFKICSTQDAEDFIQRTLLKAWANLDNYRPGTNMRGWLCTILINDVRTTHRDGRRRREMESMFPVEAYEVGAPGLAQDDRMILNETLAWLSPANRKILVGTLGYGFKYETVARVVGVAKGTIRSRISRSREKIAAYFA